MSPKINLIFYGGWLAFGLISLAYSANIKLFIQPNVSRHLPESIKQLAKFRYHFFTIWNYIIQILFLMLAVSDETTKLMNLKSVQKSIEKTRHVLFSTLVLPSTLIVISVFWSIWHVDRELIFPKVIDNFYPSWLNHTLHTLIAVPVMVEMFVQFKNQKFKVPRMLCMVGFTIYCVIYQFMFVSVYFTHGIWLYPIYNILNWTQRGIFTLAQYSIGLICQQAAITMLSKKSIKTKTT